MSRIRLLPDPLVSQIAAGEVVERPASVVKELVENALDAGASEVEVRLESGGKTRIAVADDGSGMGADDALLAFDRHATSKIANFADLERVGTLGFRGEALAAIASVARVELTTAEHPGEGRRVAIDGGRVRAAEPLPRPRGTTVEVRSLFFNVPARRKFLKSTDTELRRAVEVVQGYALARPDVRWRLLHEDRVLLDALPPHGAGGARQRIAQIFGAALAAQLAAVGDISDIGELGAAGGSDAPGDFGVLGVVDGAGAGLAGGRERLGALIGSPETARGRRQFVFVNRRLLRDRAVLAVFYRAVREEWRSEDFPALFLFLDVPPAEVDVNVHPQKAEVRFRDGRLLDRVSDLLRRGLELARGEEPALLRQPRQAPAAPFAWQGLGGAAASGSEIAEGRLAWSPSPLPSPSWPPAPGSSAPPQSAPAGGSIAGPGDAYFAGRLATPALAPAERAPVPLSGRDGQVRPFRLLGQYKGTLILLEGPDGLYVIDQHVAHERILYERLRRSLAATAPPSQRLLVPHLLDLAPAERLRLLELTPALEPCGFELTPLSGATLALAAVPAVLSGAEAERLLLALAGDGGEAGEEAARADAAAETAGTETAGALAATIQTAAPADAAWRAPRLRERILAALAASLACKAAVKMHHPLNAGAMEALVTELFAAEQPYACPHGRPIVLQMLDSDLERRFGRR